MILKEIHWKKTGLQKSPCSLSKESFIRLFVAQANISAVQSNARRESTFLDYVIHLLKIRTMILVRITETKKKGKLSALTKRFTT